MTTPLKTTRVLVGKDTALVLEIADTEEARQIGLSGRGTLGRTGGMLFAWDEDCHGRSFWMKDCYLALTLATLDDHGKIAETFNLAPLDLTRVTPAASFRYAIEVAQDVLGPWNIGENVILFDVPVATAGPCPA